MTKPPIVRAETSLTVREFFDTYQEQLQLTLVAGEEGLDKTIREKAINRPALALVGYFKFFATRRIQLFGAGEMAYLRDLPVREQKSVVEAICKKHICCMAISRNLAPVKAMVEAAARHRIPLLRSTLTSKDFSAEATLFLDQHFAPKTSLHGTLLDIRGIGTLIRGRSGVGKSECALALIERGHSLVADDITYLRLVGEKEVLGRSSELNRGYMECRGIGIINIAELFGIRNVRLEKRLDLIITFVEWVPGMEEERTGLEESFQEVLGIRVPHMEIPVRPGRDMARLVEVAAMVQATKLMGHDSAAEFNERLIAFMSAATER
ncbi:MAG: HPr(Ser) kinase/phosphatase [Opitutales bacterium]